MSGEARRSVAALCMQPTYFRAVCVGVFNRMLKVVDTRSDMWLVFEKGGDTLSKLLFDVKGETFK